MYPAARGLYHSYLEKRAVIRMPFSTMPSPDEARQICEGALYVTCDDPEEYRFRDDFFEFREKELFTRKQANAVWRSKGCAFPFLLRFLSKCDRWRVTLFMVSHG